MKSPEGRDSTMKRFVVIAISLAILHPGFGDAAQEESKTFALDEDVWVLFYDLPSRRFRRIRDAFVRRDWASASVDLTVSAGFIRAEVARANATLAGPLSETANRLEDIAENIGTSQLSGSDLDAEFARAHWLLAQHFLELSVLARDAGESRICGSYLWATTHHMERTVLWSDLRMTARQVNVLDKLRDLADRLRDAEDPARVYKERPIALARRTMLELGIMLDRKVWLVSPQ